jgi:hypothetical protein
VEESVERLHKSMILLAGGYAISRHLRVVILRR